MFHRVITARNIAGYFLFKFFGEGCGEGLATTGKCRTSGGNVPCLDCGGGQILHPSRRVDVTIYKLKSKV